MSFDHGSLNLGIRNPFRFEGTLRAIRGTLATLIGLLALLNVTSVMSSNATLGWIYALTGFCLMSSGLWTLGRGLMQVMRFYVGRSAPTSLAFNQATSEKDSAASERQDVAYDEQQIESMLVGSKNYTFKEPVGLIARLLHTLFPKITFVPYPIQNVAQRITGAFMQTVIALIAFAILSFITQVGLAGQQAYILMPIFTFTLLCYMALVWFRAGRPLARNLGRGIETISPLAFVKMVMLCTLVPVFVGSWVDSYLFYDEEIKGIVLAELSGTEFVGQLSADGLNYIQPLVAAINDGFSNAVWIMMIFVFTLMSCGLILGLTALRAMKADPTTEVSDNLPRTNEVSAKPMDIFNEFNHQVMERRRYKRVPNRIYKALTARQNPHTGEFDGEVIQETQPKVVEKNDHPLSKKLRITATSLGQSFLLIATLLVFFSLTSVGNYGAYFAPLDIQALGDSEVFNFSLRTIESFFSVLSLLIAAAIFAIFGRLLSNLSHPFWSEIQFESSLVYFKCKGSVKEDKRTFGKGYDDSTQLETSVFTSTIQPRYFIARVISSTFAGIGSTNLQFPRHIMTMYSDDALAQELDNELMESITDRAGVAETNDKQRKIIEEYNNNNLKMKSDTAAERLAPGSRDIQLTAPKATSGLLEKEQREAEAHAELEAQ
ncbi:hypothetical protein GCM10007916_07360 [Psychromonas marina]|uniref:Uncharacterized protein n=1 Tax=Psychromonas marina TaxID=88364 RepID=A0ABQ6DX21_9GAMM|nr:hypothetical protein [Psychromonas marina]GLS89669.1 hypothetical protein GCM10007916_07360 [Psychromonas marina]